MIYKILKIKYPLSRYIDSIYYMSMEGDSFKKNVIPDGKTDIIFNLNSSKIGFYKDGDVIYSSDSVLQGLRKKNFQYIAIDAVEIIGIRLMPFGVYTLFNVPLTELSEDPIELSMIAGNGVKGLEEKICDVPDIDSKIKIVQNWLFSLFVKKEERHGLLIDTIYRIYSTKGKLTINLACRENYNYYKKIQRSFRDTIGISPKLYARMVRFENIHNELQTTEKIDWFNIIDKFDFFDYSHLTKEFQFFTGHTPNEFVHRIESFV
jgi:AraC-like DNA-binding protein